jgi:Chaperone of endosialidase
MSRQIQAALARFVDDEQYRKLVANDPQRIASDFHLTGAELDVLNALGRTDGAGVARARMAGGCSCSSGGVRSDRRLKTAVTEVAALPSGLRLYRFKYRWSETEYVGVMAQEVSEIAPHAVIEGDDDFLRVDYDALGLTMQPYAAWIAAGGADARVA